MTIRTFLIVAFLAVIALPAAAQEDEPDTLIGWNHSLQVGGTLSQTALSNWEQGGESALAWTFLAAGESVEQGEMHTWTTSYNMAFGQAKVGEGGIRKTDDKIDFSSVYVYNVWGKVNPYGAVTALTQFARGFTYDTLDQATAVSQFVDPLYLTQSAGLTYKPVAEVETRLGAALREVLTDQFNQYSDDPETPEIEKTLVEGGMESVTKVAWDLDEDILFSTQLNLFAPFGTLDQIVVRGNAGITGKIGDFFTVKVQMDVINEPRVSPYTQIKESLAVGLSFVIL